MDRPQRTWIAGGLRGAAVALTSATICVGVFAWTTSGPMIEAPYLVLLGLGLSLAAIGAFSGWWAADHGGNDSFAAAAAAAVLIGIGALIGSSAFGAMDDLVALGPILTSIMPFAAILGGIARWTGVGGRHSERDPPET